MKLAIATFSLAFAAAGMSLPDIAEAQSRRGMSRSSRESSRSATRSRSSRSSRRATRSRSPRSSRSATRSRSYSRRSPARSYSRRAPARSFSRRSATRSRSRRSPARSYNRRSATRSYNRRSATRSYNRRAVRRPNRRAYRPGRRAVRPNRRAYRPGRRAVRRSRRALRRNYRGRRYFRRYATPFVVAPSYGYYYSSPSTVTLVNSQDATVTLQVRLGNSSYCSSNSYFASYTLDPGEAVSLNTHSNYICTQSTDSYGSTDWLLETVQAGSMSLGI